MRQLLERHGLRPVKNLGQHFLADPNVVRRIASAAHIESGDRVLEIGAGTGALTRELAASGAHVLSLEVDRRLKPLLEEALRGVDVDLRFADALNFDFESELGSDSWKLVANLPYEVGTTLLLRLIREVPAIWSFTVMVQDEVGRRLTASAGSPEYGLPSVIVGLHGTGRLLFKVPPQVFYPPPRVESVVVHITRTPSLPLTDRAIQLASAAFAQRRKMLRSSLRTIFSDPEVALRKAGIEPTRRPESLSPREFLHLAASSS